jgi:hypothetical protein
MARPQQWREVDSVRTVPVGQGALALRVPHPLNGVSREFHLGVIYSNQRRLLLLQAMAAWGFCVERASCTYLQTSFTASVFTVQSNYCVCVN